MEKIFGGAYGTSNSFEGGGVITTLPPSPWTFLTEGVNFAKNIGNKNHCIISSDPCQYLENLENSRTT